VRTTAVFMALFLVAAFGCNSGSSSSSSNPNPVIVSPADGSTLLTATIGVVYTQTFSVVSGGTAPFTFVPAGLPGGLTFITLSGSEGSLSGTPNQAGTGTFSIQVIDAQNLVTQLSYTLTVSMSSPVTLPSETDDGPSGFSPRSLQLDA